MNTCMNSCMVQNGHGKREKPCAHPKVHNMRWPVLPWDGVRFLLSDVEHYATQEFRNFLAHVSKLTMSDTTPKAFPWTHSHQDPTHPISWVQILLQFCWITSHREVSTWRSGAPQTSFTWTVAQAAIWIWNVRCSQFKVKSQHQHNSHEWKLRSEEPVLTNVTGNGYA